MAELLHERLLAVRAHAGLHILVRDPDLVGNGPRRTLLVARREQDLDAHPPERVDGLARLGLDLVGERDDARELTVDGDEDAGAA